MAEASLDTNEHNKIPKKCDLCDENEISWNCSTCQENICHHCKKAHLKSKASCDHTILPIERQEDDLPVQQEEEKHEKSQKGPPSCTEHPKEKTIMYCRECNLLICRDCISSEKHRPHELIKIEEIIKEKQIKLSEVTEKADQTLKIKKNILKDIKENRSNYPVEFNRCIDEIKLRNTQIKQKFDQITDNLIQKLKKSEDQSKIFNRREKQVNKDISALKNLVKTCKAKQKQRDTGLIDFVPDANKNLEKFKSNNPPDRIIPPVFKCDDLDLEKLKELFGDLEEEQGSDFVWETSSISSDSDSNSEIQDTRPLVLSNLRKVWSQTRQSFTQLRSHFPDIRS